LVLNLVYLALLLLRSLVSLGFCRCFFLGR
jgi:hypothetical protein